MAEVTLWRIAKILDDFPKFGRLWGVDGELGKLKKTVSALQNVSHDAEKRKVDSGEIEEWIGELEAALYDAEDLLEEWDMEVTRRGLPIIYEKLKQVITSSSPSSPLARVRKIRKRIESIAAEGRKFDLRVQDERGSRNRERSDCFVYEEEIIGREGEKSAIMKFLFDSGTEEKITVLAICGNEGIGKTALARWLYKDDMVNMHFDLTIWRSLSTKKMNTTRLPGEPCDFVDYKILLRQIIESGATETADDLELAQLQYLVGKLIRGKKFLLVLDDVEYQFPQQWKSLKRLLMGGAGGSKILITTVDRSIADYISSCFLEALSESSSLDLLMRMACQEEEETGDSKKRAIARRLVRNCCGIPLYIRMLGSVLFFEKTEAEWLRFEREIEKEGRGHFGIKSLGNICYRHLPSHLKLCLALCSLFPRCGVIDKLMLTTISWIYSGGISFKTVLQMNLEM